MGTAKEAIILDGSWLAGGIYKAILYRYYHLECALHIEDVDVLIKGKKGCDLIVVGGGIYEAKAWEALNIRQTCLIKTRKIFIAADGKDHPAGFIPLSNPFRPEELLEAAGVDIPRSGLQDKVLPPRGTGGEKRIFGRAPIAACVYLSDENGCRLVTLQGCDIGSSGMCIEGRISFRIGTSLFLSFQLDNKDMFVTGEVVWTFGNKIGIRFVGPISFLPSSPKHQFFP